MNVFKRIAMIPSRWLDPVIQDRNADVYGYYRGIIVRLCPHVDEGNLWRIDKWVPEASQKGAVDLFFLQEKMRSPKFGIVCGKLDCDMIIVDTNIFMNAATQMKRQEIESDSQLMCTITGQIISYDKMSNVEIRSNVWMWNSGEDSPRENCRRCAEFFHAVKDLKLKIHILTSQLNEISNLKRGDNPEKQFLARGAQKIIEELQNLDLLDVLDDVVSNNQSYADPEILKVVRRNQTDGCKTLVITEDRDLRIRVTAISSLAKSMNEIYHAGGFAATDFKDGLRSYISVRGVHCGGKFVCMNKDGDAELIANRTVADEWETFALVMNPQGSWSLQSKANGKFVCADVNQNGKLLARNETVDGSAEFELVPIGGKRPRFALKSKANDKYVSVCENQGNVLFANGPEIRDWEMLEFA